MRHFISFNFIYTLFALISALHVPASKAEDQKPLELEQRYVQWRTDYVVNENFTVQST